MKPETDNGAKGKLKGKGFPVYKKEGTFGDLYLTYQVVLPKNLSEEEKALFRQLAKLERLLRLNQDLDINVAGLCVVHELLEERKRLQEELNRLRRQVERWSMF